MLPVWQSRSLVAVVAGTTVSLKEHILFAGTSWGERKVSLRVSYGPDNGLKGRDTVGAVGWRMWSSLEKGESEGQRWLRKESAQRCWLHGVQCFCLRNCTQPVCSTLEQHWGRMGTSSLSACRKRQHLVHDLLTRQWRVTPG